MSIFQNRDHPQINGQGRPRWERIWVEPLDECNRWGRQFRSNTTGEIYGHLIFKVPPPSITAKYKSSKCFLWLATSTIYKRQSSRFTTVFSDQEISHHWSCLCLLEFPSLLPESSICTNPPAPDDNGFCDKLPVCGGRDRKMETANGKMSFPPSD